MTPIIRERLRADHHHHHQLNGFRMFDENPLRMSLSIMKDSDLNIDTTSILIRRGNHLFESSNSGIRTVDFFFHKICRNSHLRERF